MAVVAGQGGMARTSDIEGSDLIFQAFVVKKVLENMYAVVVIRTLLLRRILAVSQSCARCCGW